MTATVPETNRGVAELSAAQRAALDKATKAHRNLINAQAEVEKLLAERRKATLAALMSGVSGYRLAKAYGVSQTTIGNIRNGG